MNMEKYFVVNKDYTDVTNGLINLHDIVQTVQFSVGDKIILQDNNRSYNSTYFNGSYYKYFEIVEVDNVSQNIIRFKSIYKPVVGLNIKNGYNGYFENSVDQEFQVFRITVRKISYDEFYSIYLYMKYLNKKMPISKLLDLDLGPRLENVVEIYCKGNNLSYTGELVQHFGLIRKYTGLGIEGHKLLSRKISSLYQSRLDNAIASDVFKESDRFKSKIQTQLDLVNFSLYLNERGSARIINRIDDIISAVEQVGIERIFGVGKIRGLGKKSLRDLAKLVQEYNPNIKYGDVGVKFPLTIEGCYFMECPTIESLFGYFNETPDLSYRSCRKITQKLFDNVDSRKDLDIVDLSSCEPEFILFHGFIKISPLSFFIINKFFPSLLNLSKERIRQLFFKDSNHRPILIKYETDQQRRHVGYNLFGYDNIDVDLLIDTRNIFGLNRYKGSSIVTDRSFEVKYEGRHHKIIFDGLGFNRVEEVLSESVSLSNQVLTMIEGFVGLHEARGVTTDMISEDLLEFNLVYSHSQINYLCRSKSSKLKRRLDKTWVIKDGLLDRDPDFKSYSEWFTFLIEKGNSPLKAIKIVREVYPNYKLKNLVALLQRKLGKDWKSKNFIMLNSDPFEKSYLNKLRKILNNPGILQSESITWPLFWFDYVEDIKVSLIDGEYRLIFKCKNHIFSEDIKTIIESFLWKAKAVYTYDEE